MVAFEPFILGLWVKVSTIDLHDVIARKKHSSLFPSNGASAGIRIVNPKIVSQDFATLLAEHNQHLTLTYALSRVQYLRAKRLNFKCKSVSAS